LQYPSCWYVSLLENAINLNGPWTTSHAIVNNAWLLQHLSEKIDGIDCGEASAHVARFLKPIEQEALALWSRDFFSSRLEKLGRALA